MTINAGTTAEQTTETDPLLASKLAVPSAPPFTVERERLISLLSQSVHNPMTVVTGPPGSGKTQLVASWVTSGAPPGPVVWITLEAGDDDPGVFWSYLLAGLRRGGITLSAAIDQAVRGGTFDRTLLARLAADIAAGRDPVTLVLDSVSFLTDRQLAEDLDALLRHADRHLRMVLVGRWDPPLPLYRYRLNGTLSEIRGDDLAFTAAETATLLAGHAVDLPTWAVASLVERTDGWAAGLRLFAMAMEGRADAEDLVATIASDDASIAEYFLGEVLAAQPVEIRDFLLRTSIVDEFTVELAEALIERGDARPIIARLERANAFVQPVAVRSAVHRYNRLFRELLRAQLNYEDPRLATQLNRRAAAWFAASGDISTAVQHAAAAADWQHASALVVRNLAVGRLLAGEDSDRLGGLFQAMPADLDGADIALVHAARELAAARPDEARKHLDQVIPHPAVDTGSAHDVPLRLTAAVLGALAAALRHDASALPLAETAESLLGQACPAHVAARPELRTIIQFAKGTALARAGLLGDAITVLSEAAAAPWPAGGDRLQLVCLEQLALAHAFQGRLRDAGDAAARAAQLDKQRRRTSAPQSAAVCAVLAWVAAERWVVAVAWRHLRAAEAVLAVGGDPMTTAAVALVRSRLLSGRGELRGAVRALSLVQTDEDLDVPPWLRQRITLSEARLAVAMGSAGQALDTAAAVAPMATAEAAVVSAAACIAAGDVERAYEMVLPITATTGLPVPLLIEAWLIVAISAGESGAAGTAREALQQALALADADGHRRAFHQAGPWLRHLLRNDAELAAAYQTLGASPATKAVRAAMGPVAPPAPAVIDPLSERELQVLTHLAAMLGTEEIADAMYLSVNTVKTHVRSILRKLAVSRRNEAVRRARELGIV